MRESLRSNPQHGDVRSLYFDGKKGKTLENYLEEDGKFHRRVVTEELVCVISEPGSEYVCHFSTNTGSSKDIATSMINTLHEQKIDFSHLKAIACDGTAVNTGYIGGVIGWLKLQMSRPLQWFVCLLHENELSLRHLLYLSLWMKPQVGLNAIQGLQEEHWQLVKSCPSHNFIRYLAIFRIQSPQELSTD